MKRTVTRIRFALAHALVTLLRLIGGVGAHIEPHLRVDLQRARERSGL